VAREISGKIGGLVSRRLVPSASKSTIFGLPVFVATTQSTWVGGLFGRSTVVMTISVSALARARPMVMPTP